MENVHMLIRSAEGDTKGCHVFHKAGVEPVAGSETTYEEHTLQRHEHQLVERMNLITVIGIDAALRWCSKEAIISSMDGSKSLATSSLCDYENPTPQ